MVNLQFQHVIIFTKSFGGCQQVTYVLFRFALSRVTMDANR